MPSKEILVLALGGNAIATRSRTFQSQFAAVSKVTRAIARLANDGYRIVITHGNGPQVGDSLVRHQMAKRLAPPLPLYACVAETQGLIGFMIQASLSGHLACGKVASLISMVYVSDSDPSFHDPAKPVGSTYKKSELRFAGAGGSDVFKEVLPGKYRKVVASPEPLSVTGIEAVKQLLKSGYVVIAAGGGGIPVVRRRGKIAFVEAVVDKDLTSERLASGIGASKLVMLTDVEGAYLDFAGRKRLLKSATAGEMNRLLRSGEFGAGSMAPKVKAAVRFAEATGNNAVICSMRNLSRALSGRAGTTIHP